MAGYPATVGGWSASWKWSIILAAGPFPISAISEGSRAVEADAVVRQEEEEEPVAAPGRSITIGTSAFMN